MMLLLVEVAKRRRSACRFWLPVLAPDAAVLRTLALKLIRKLEASVVKAATATLPIVTRTFVGRSTTEATVTTNCSAVGT